MNQIQPHLLWLGPSKDESDLRRIFDTGIRAIVHLAAEELPPGAPRDLISCHFPLLDGPGNELVLLSLSIKTVAALLTSRIATLITCGHGLSRSAAVAAAALSLAHDTHLEASLAEVVLHNPSDVSPGFWSEVVGLFPELQKKATK